MMTKFSFIFLLLIFSSCSSEKPKGKTEAEVLFKEAQELYTDEQYTIASQKLNELRNKYPYSFFATPAELMQADILFEQESFVEAAAAYMVFRDLHPRHEKLDYVIFRIAESYYKQLPPGHDRDLAPAEEAIKYFNELLTKYSTSQYTGSAQDKIQDCKKLLFRKEQYIADFYYKTSEYFAARWRYLDILANYTNKDLRQHSIERAILASSKLKDFEQCSEILKKFSNELSSSQANELKSICN